MKWFYLVLAIVGELIATSALKESKGFTKLLPSFITVLGYGFTFYFLALAIKEIPLGIAYAVWAGLGITLVTAVDYFRFHQKLDLPTVIGISLVILGVVIIQLFSNSNEITQ